MGAIRRAHKSPDYHMGYSDGFNAGVQHAQKFIESQAQPNVVIALPANSQPQAAADVVLVSREEAAKVADKRGMAHQMQIASIKKEYGGRPTITLVDANGRNDEDELIAAAIRALPPHGKE